MSWENLEIKTAKLSFINSDNDLKSLIQNTILFSHLMKKFEAVQLSEFLESTQYGYTASAAETGSFRLLRITDIQNGKVNWETVPFCDCERSENYLLDPNDFLIARTGGTTGKSFLVQTPPDNAVFASYLIRLRFKNDVNVKFIQRFLNSYLFWSQIIELKAGTAQPNVNAEKLKTLLIPHCLPVFQNQIISETEADWNADGDTVISRLLRKSSRLFDNLKGIETELTHQRALLTRLRQSILQDAVQGRLTAQWRQAHPHQEPASELLRRIREEKAALGKKEKNLPPVREEEMPFELPEGWVWCRLGEVGIIGPRNHADNDIEASFIPMSLISDEFGRTPEFEIKKWKTIKSGFTHFQDDDVAVAKITPCFENSKAAIFRGLINGIGAGTTELHVFRTFSRQLILPEFIYITFKTSTFLIEGEFNMRGVAGQKRIPTDFVKNYLIALPPLSEQTAIVARVEAMLERVSALEAESARQRAWAEGLLQAALREAMGG